MPLLNLSYNAIYVDMPHERYMMFYLHTRLRTLGVVARWYHTSNTANQTK